MIVKEVTLINKLGMHARAATKFVQLAQKFRSKIIVEKDGVEINGKSILGLMTLAAPVGSKLVLKVDGEDEEEAMKALVELINNRFGEPE